METVKRHEFAGLTYDGAEASFELLALRTLGRLVDPFRLVSYRVLDERRTGDGGDVVLVSEATVKLDMLREDGLRREMAVAEGNGPVNALDTALRSALLPEHPCLADTRLVDYKVRILTPEDGTRAVTRVIIETADSRGMRWRTVGVSGNVVDASYRALADAAVWRLARKI